MDVSRFEILLASIVCERHPYECPGQGIKLNVMLEYARSFATIVA